MTVKGNRLLFAGLVCALAAFVGGGWNGSGPKPLAMAAENGATAPPQPMRRSPSAANSFNRLMKKPTMAPNARPAEDGIHDPVNPGTNLLQWPSEAFQNLPRTMHGNRIDWSKALLSGAIKPRYELDDPNAEVFTMDLVIVREVKGSMPDVVFSHLPHTKWLDCTNCHDGIFVPEKGANQISMAAILLGKKCGVCHGTVAFPVSDCKRCHAKPKTPDQLRALAKRSAWRNGGKSGEKANN